MNPKILSLSKPQDPGGPVDRPSLLVDRKSETEARVSRAAVLLPPFDLVAAHPLCIRLTCVRLYRATLCGEEDLARSPSLYCCVLGL